MVEHISWWEREGGILKEIAVTAIDDGSHERIYRCGIYLGTVRRKMWRFQPAQFVEQVHAWWAQQPITVLRPECSPTALRNAAE
jgi:hypothetical protein